MALLMHIGRETKINSNDNEEEVLVFSSSFTGHRKHRSEWYYCFSQADRGGDGDLNESLNDTAQVHLLVVAWLDVPKENWRVSCLLRIYSCTTPASVRSTYM